MTVISVSGRVRHIRPLPSDSTTHSVPVSATAKLAPLIRPPWRTGTCRRRCAGRPRPARPGSSVSAGVDAGHLAQEDLADLGRGCGGSPAPGCGRAGRGRAARSARPGRSRTRRCPAAASASLSPISWVAIDLTLTTSVAPVARTRSVTIRLASSASRAQCTVPPRAVTSRLELLQSAGPGRAMRVGLDRRPASRSSSQSGSSATTAARLARIVRGGVAQVARAAGCRPARGAPPTGNGSAAAQVARRQRGAVSACRGTSVTDAPDATGSASRGQDLGQVHACCTPVPQPGQPAADVHQAGASPACTPRRPVPQTLRILSASIARRDVGVLQRERAAEAAALVGVGQLDQVERRPPARSSRSGLSPTRSSRSEWQVGW